MIAPYCTDLLYMLTDDYLCCIAVLVSYIMIRLTVLQ